MNNQEIIRAAMEQSAIDLHCEPSAFEKEENIIVYSEKHERARRYLTLPFQCNLVSYGSNIVASIQPEYHDIVDSYLSNYDVSHCLETPNMHVLGEAFAPFGLKICFMAEYFLPNVEALKILPCEYEIRMMEQKDFSDLYTEEWSNALCEKRKELDVLGAGAFDNGKLIGLAGCSADCDTMWQIGIDVLPEYRRKGIASALTSRLAVEIMQRGKVPFYCCAWCNLKSARNALKSGFKPAWVEMTVKPEELVAEMNHRGKD